MAQRLQSICDVDQGWVTKDRGGMVVVGLGNDELHASFKMTPECFERFYQDLTQFRKEKFKDKTPPADS